LSSQPIPLPDQISGYRSSVINQIRDYLISVTPVDGPFLRWIRRPDGLFPVLNEAALGSAAAIDYRFKLQLNSTANTVTMVNSGTIRLIGQGNYTLSAGTEITLTGSPDVWVYVYMPARGGAVELKQSVTEPICSTSHLAIPLVKYSLSGSTYTEDSVCQVGDILLGAVLP